jgi:hypothetical protein
LPAPITEAFADVSRQAGGKKKSVVLCAAIIALVEMPEKDQREMIRRVQMAEAVGGSYESLVAAARAKGGHKYTRQPLNARSLARGRDKEQSESK